MLLSMKAAWNPAKSITSGMVAELVGRIKQIACTATHETIIHRQKTSFSGPLINLRNFAILLFAIMWLSLFLGGWHEYCYY